MCVLTETLSHTEEREGGRERENRNLRVTRNLPDTCAAKDAVSDYLLPLTMVYNPQP